MLTTDQLRLLEDHSREAVEASCYTDLAAIAVGVCKIGDPPTWAKDNRDFVRDLSEEGGELVATLDGDPTLLRAALEWMADDAILEATEIGFGPRPAELPAVFVAIAEALRTLARAAAATGKSRWVMWALDAPPEGRRELGPGPFCIRDRDDDDRHLVETPEGRTRLVWAAWVVERPYDTAPCDCTRCGAQGTACAATCSRFDPALPRDRHALVGLTTGATCAGCGAALSPRAAYLTLAGTLVCAACHDGADHGAGAA